MTQKHFKIIANIIDTLPMQKEVRRQVAIEFAERLQAANPKFNRAKFIEAAMRNPAA
jgi:hypothetical protein